LEAWLRKQPREVSVAFAARAALRVLPVVQLEKRETYIRDLVLPVSRATVVSWAAAKYPAREKELATACRAAAAGLAAQSTGSTWGSGYAAAASRAADYAAVVTIRGTASADAANAAAAAVDAVAAFGTGFSLGFNLDLATAFGANPVVDAFWSAVSVDVTRVEEGAAASVIASLPLWPQGQPDQLQSLWQEMKTALLAAKQDWQVWTVWYDDRLAGHVRDEERELAYVRIEEALWDQGPAVVNAEIKRRIEELEPPNPVVGPTGPIMADIEPPASETNTHFIGRFQPTVLRSFPYNSWDSGAASMGVTEPEPKRRRKKEPKPSPAEVSPPESPLPPPSPATRFVVEQEIVDVVPSTAWAGREAQVATYHARARTIALRFSDKLANTNVEPELAASVHALVEVLGDDPAQLQPDQLRLASRTIASKARAYGHPSARWELGVESVSTLFELADVLVSLQALASPELEEHERAIRALDLTEASVAEAKEGLDLVSEAIAAAPEIVSDRASVAFEASATASDNAADKTVQITIEGERIILTENLVLAVARALAEPELKAEVAEVETPSTAIVVQKERPTQRKKTDIRGGRKGQGDAPLGSVSV
jgi:hypothetical protein